MKWKRLRPWNRLRWSEIIGTVVGPKLSALELILSSDHSATFSRVCNKDVWFDVRLNERYWGKKPTPVHVCPEKPRSAAKLPFKLLQPVFFFSFFFYWGGVGGGWAGPSVLMKFSPASPSSSSASLLFLISCLMGSHVIMFNLPGSTPPLPRPPPPPPLRLNYAANEECEPLRMHTRTRPGWSLQRPDLLMRSRYRLNSSCQCSDEPAHFITLRNCFPFSVVFFSDWKTAQWCGINRCLFYDTVDPNVSLVQLWIGDGDENTWSVKTVKVAEFLEQDSTHAPQWSASFLTLDKTNSLSRACRCNVMAPEEGLRLLGWSPAPPVTQISHNRRWSVGLLLLYGWILFFPTKFFLEMNWNLIRHC